MTIKQICITKNTFKQKRTGNRAHGQHSGQQDESADQPSPTHALPSPATKSEMATLVSLLEREVRDMSLQWLLNFRGWVPRMKKLRPAPRELRAVECSLFKGWGKSEYSLPCFTCCQELRLKSNVCLSGTFNLIFPNPFST